MTPVRTALSALLALAAATACLAQDARPIAFTNARLLPVSGPAIERGTLVVRNGKIEAIGADAVVPPGARVVDCAGKTVMPGLVSAWSRAGLGGQGQPRTESPFGGRRGGRGGMEFPMPMGGGGTQNKPATKVVDGLYAKQPVFGELLRAGVTSLALTPNGGGFPGLGAVLRPDGKTVEQLTVDDDAFVQVGMVRDTGTKKLLKDQFDKAQKVVDERKKPPAPPTPPPQAQPQQPPAEAKPGEAKQEPPKGNEPPKPGPNPTPTPTPTPNPTPTPTPQPTPAPAPAPQGQPAPQQPPQQAPKAPPKDPNLEVLADLLEGKRRAIVQIDTAADLLHWQDAVGDKLSFPRAVAVARHDPTAGTLDLTLEQVKAWKCPVLLPPAMSVLPRSRYLVHPSLQFHDAGVEVAFAVGESGTAVRQLFFNLMELCRYGLPQDVALKGVTLLPAKILGIDKATGSLEVGKDADLLVFSGDPMSPAGELHSVWLRGVETKKEP